MIALGDLILGEGHSPTLHVVLHVVDGYLRASRLHHEDETITIFLEGLSLGVLADHLDFTDGAILGERLTKCVLGDVRRQVPDMQLTVLLLTVRLNIISQTGLFGGELEILPQRRLGVLTRLQLGYVDREGIILNLNLLGSIYSVTLNLIIFKLARRVLLHVDNVRSVLLVRLRIVDVGNEGFIYLLF